jgi:hypothetical protein
MTTSNKIRSGMERSASLRATSPAEATMTRYPAVSRDWHSTSRLAGTSSTTKIRDPLRSIFSSFMGSILQDVHHLLQFVALQRISQAAGQVFTRQSQGCQLI